MVQHKHYPMFIGVFLLGIFSQRVFIYLKKNIPCSDVCGICVHTLKVYIYCYLGNFLKKIDPIVKITAIETFVLCSFLMEVIYNVTCQASVELSSFTHIFSFFSTHHHGLNSFFIGQSKEHFGAFMYTALCLFDNPSKIS